MASSESAMSSEVPQESYVSPLAILKGPYSVHFSIGCIVHPFAVIVAQRGPIYFGAYCIVEENANIINGKEEVEGITQELTSVQSMSIGPYNHFKAFSYLLNVQRIGNSNYFEPHCYLNGGSSLSCYVEDYTVLGPFAHVTSAVPSRVVVLCSSETNAKCICSSLNCSCCKCWVLPRGDLFDDEEVEEVMRKKCCRFLNLNATF